MERNWALRRCLPEQLLQGFWEACSKAEILNHTGVHPHARTHTLGLVSLSLSLSLSHTHTHTHTHTHSALFLSLTHTHTHTLGLDTDTHTHTHSLAQAPGSGIPVCSVPQLILMVLHLCKDFPLGMGGGVGVSSCPPHPNQGSSAFMFCMGAAKTGVLQLKIKV